MDWLMKTALDALEAKSDYESKGLDEKSFLSWIANKRKEKAKATRLESLRFICHSLDKQNQMTVCDALDISFSDLEATARILQKV